MDLSALFSNIFKPSSSMPTPQQVQPLPVTVAGQTFYPTNNPAPGTAPNYSSTDPNAQSPTLSALLGGLKAVGGQQGGSQLPQANGGNGGMQSNTAQLAAYKPMSFAGRAMVPPQIMAAIMASGGR